MTLRCRRRGPGRGGPRGPSGGGGARAGVGARRGADPGGRGAGAASGRQGGGAVGRPAGQEREALPFGARGAPCPPGFGYPTGGLSRGPRSSAPPRLHLFTFFPGLTPPWTDPLPLFSLPFSSAGEENSRKLEPHRSPVKMKVSGAGCPGHCQSGGCSCGMASFCYLKLISLLRSTFRKMTCEWVRCVVCMCV